MSLTETDILKAAFETTLLRYESRMGANDNAFIRRIFADGLQKYIDRLCAIGFTDKSHVLDAGCGFGQWALSLSKINCKVSACDVSQLRTDFLIDLSRKLRLANLDVHVSELDKLPYESGVFDAVFCYSAIFLTPWRQSLREFQRVLKPGGKLYINANGVGWYMFLWHEARNRTSDYDPQTLAARSFTDTLRYEREGACDPGMHLIIEPQQLHDALLSLGFADIKTAHEGSLHLNTASAPPSPFFQGEYFGQMSVFEVVAEKR